MIKILISLFYFTICLTVAGCGGGGGSASSATKSKTTSKVVFGSTVSNELVGTLRLTISIPYGVTIPLASGITYASDAASITALNSVVQVTTKTSVDLTKLLASVNYTPAVPNKPGSIEILYAKADGFIPDINTLLIQFDITTGSFPSPQDFVIAPIYIAKIIPDDPSTPLIDESGVTARIEITNIQYTVELI
ncbi:MAG: hypothetical protein HXX17_00110 [Geobacteraceae bacterium]|nr:hypothetical protein [Geobacteraceae bacterium]